MADELIDDPHEHQLTHQFLEGSTELSLDELQTVSEILAALGRDCDRRIAELVDKEMANE